MRIPITTLFVLAVLASSVFAQTEVSQLRADPGRSGEFTVSPIKSFDRLLWKSPKLFEVSITDRGMVDTNVLGERLRFEQRRGSPISPSGIREAVSGEREFGIESMPLHHKGNLHIAVNFGPASFWGSQSEPGDGFLLAIDAQNGKPQWVYRCGDCYISNPVGFNDWIIVISRNRSARRDPDGAVTAIDRSTGQRAWSVPAGTSLSTPTIHNEVLYFADGPTYAQTSTSTLHALDLKARKIVWSFAAKGFFNSPAISGGLAFVGSNKDYLYAIDLVTGQEKWRFKAEARRPAARDGVVYFSDFSKLYAVDAASGNLKWKIKVPEGVTKPLAISKSSVFFSSEGRKFYAVDVSNGQIRWSIKTKLYPYEPVIAGNRVFVGGTEELLMLDTETGQKFDTVKLGPNIAYTPTLLDDIAIIYNGDGFFFAATK